MHILFLLGYISDIDAGTIAQVSWRLGAGRDKPDASIDHTVGIRLLKHVGDAVEKGGLFQSFKTFLKSKKRTKEDLLSLGKKSPEI